jgi:hypothetical protein
VGVIANHSGGSSLEFVLYFDGVPPNLADVAVGVPVKHENVLLGLGLCGQQSGWVLRR